MGDLLVTEIEDSQLQGVELLSLVELGIEGTNLAQEISRKWLEFISRFVFSFLFAEKCVRGV